METQELASAKKAIRKGRTLVFIDESGLAERCPLSCTWAPAGRTPVIQQSFTCSRFRPLPVPPCRGCTSASSPTPLGGGKVIKFLGALMKQIGEPPLVICDGVGMRKSRKVRHWLKARGRRMAVAFPPPYAPELHSVGRIWAYLGRVREPLPDPPCRGRSLRQRAPEAVAAATAAHPSLLATSRTGAET